MQTCRQHLLAASTVPFDSSNTRLSSAAQRYLTLVGARNAGQLISHIHHSSHGIPVPDGHRGSTSSPIVCAPGRMFMTWTFHQHARLHRRPGKGLAFGWPNRILTRASAQAWVATDDEGHLHASRARPEGSVRLLRTLRPDALGLGGARARLRRTEIEVSGCTPRYRFRPQPPARRRVRWWRVFSPLVDSSHGGRRT